MRIALIIVAALAEVVSWRILARPGRATEWNLMIAVFLVQGVVALILWHVEWFSDMAPLVSIAVGLASGAVLYAGTRAFVGVAVRSPLFREHVADQYDRARQVSLPVGLALAALVAVPGEELFWRGAVQGLAGDHWSEVVGMLVALVGYIGVNTASGKLPLVAAAVVGGLAWGGLTLFTGGILAAVMCHGLWTGLMLAYPPRAGRSMGAPREMMPS